MEVFTIDHDVVLNYEYKLCYNTLLFISLLLFLKYKNLGMIFLISNNTFVFVLMLMLNLLSFKVFVYNFSFCIFFSF
jgi:hypothetical protein